MAGVGIGLRAHSPLSTRGSAWWREPAACPAPHSAGGGVLSTSLLPQSLAGEPEDGEPHVQEARSQGCPMAREPEGPGARRRAGWERGRGRTPIAWSKGRHVRAQAGPPRHQDPDPWYPPRGSGLGSDPERPGNPSPHLGGLVGRALTIHDLTLSSPAHTYPSPASTSPKFQGESGDPSDAPS